MTVHTITADGPAGFDAGLPAIAYEQAQDPDEAHRLIRQACAQGPIALGPHGPEVLSYELVRTVLRDPRFQVPKGVALAAQGITSGRLWDRATAGLLSRDGADHQRLRRLVCTAFTPRSTARLQTTIVDVISEVVDPQDMIAHRRHHLTDDLISELIRSEDDGDRLGADELTMLAATLLMAGTDTTRNQLAAAVGDLCDHPQQWALLADHPELAPRAVEELMRHRPVIFTTMRTASEDVRLGEVTIPAGTLVMVNTAAANRDPVVYDDPDRLDFTREGPATMLSFGGGIHYCLGTHLARAELAEALAVITQRMPNPHRAGPAPWKPLVGITGPTTLPIEFDAGH